MIERWVRMLLRLTRGAPAVTALAALVAALAPFSAEAALQGSAGNTIVRNTITVDYSDARGTPQAQVTSFADFTVNTIAATPSVLSFTAGSGTDGTGATEAYTVRIRTNSNGPGLITLGAADTASTNMTSYGAAPSGLAAGIFLGSTVIDPSDGNGTIASWASGASVSFKIPNDAGIVSDGAVTGGTNSDGVVNGLKDGDIVYLYSGSAYYGPFSVGTVTEVAAGSVAPCTIQLSNSLGAGNLTSVPTGYGWQIVEAMDVTMTVTQGVVTDATLAASWSTTVTATMGAAAGGTGVVVTAARQGKISVTKYVRNVTTPVVGTGSSGPITINSGSFTYYSAGVNGKPGEVLEYLAAVKDTGTGSSTTIVAIDSLPYYTTLLTGPAYGTAGVGTIFARAGLGATETNLNTAGTLGNAGVAYGASTGTAGGSNMSFYLGNGSSSSGGGTLTAGQTVYLIYRLTIN